MTTKAAERRSVRGVSMSLPRKPTMGGKAHVDAIARLDAAVGGRERLSQASETAHGAAEERDAAVAVADANENVAAREAWLHYIEHGY